jgi:hypothetical protein
MRRWYEPWWFAAKSGVIMWWRINVAMVVGAYQGFEREYLKAHAELDEFDAKWREEREKAKSG